MTHYNATISQFWIDFSREYKRAPEPEPEPPAQQQHACIEDEELAQYEDIPMRQWLAMNDVQRTHIVDRYYRRR